MMLLNGRIKDDFVGDSKCSYFKGPKKSQNDVCICNDVNDVKSFKISEKSIYSDHCPILLTIAVETSPSLTVIKECAKNTFNYDHLDINIDK